MMMLCWWYCIPFAIFMYYAAAPLTILFSAFILKRGICRRILWMRRFAFALMFTSVGKIFVLDLPELVQGSPIYQGAIFSFFFLVCGVLFMLGQYFGKSYRYKKQHKKDDKDLRVWANTSMIATIVLISWLLFPWVSHLAIGSAPKVFELVSWRVIAAFNLMTLLVGFWMAEEYYWFYNESHKGKRRGAARVWVPSDTLWLVLPLYLITLAFAVMAEDVM